MDAEGCNHCLFLGRPVIIYSSGVTEKRRKIPVRIVVTTEIRT
jgi:hypothetical protein